MKNKANLNIKIIRFKQNVISLFSPNKDDVKLLDVILEHYFQLEKAEGTIQATKICKEALRLTSRYLLGQVTEKQLGPRWISTDKQGLPSYLKITLGRAESFRKHPHRARFLLTALAFYKLIIHEVNYDVSTIVNPCSSPVMKQTASEIEKRVPQILKDLRFPQFEKTDCSPIFVTTKAGANGPKAMGATSLIDLKAVMETGILPRIEQMYQLLYKAKDLRTIQEILSASIESIDPDTPSTNITARNHFISEGGGKTRIVCIGDIWTQVALKPIHDFIMKGLERIPQDGTSSHNNLAIKLCNWTKEEKFYCFDLTAATDRMPIYLQNVVLTHIFGKEIADLWSQLLVDRNIHCNGEPLRYAVGQPMGFLSSWAAMALTHHVIINYCYDLTGIKPRDRKYCVIGDDMAISDKQTALHYQELLSKLGMEISIGKSIIPNDTYNSAEIAKRYFRNGIEISPITPEQVLLGTNSLNDLLSLWRTLSTHSYFKLPFGENQNDSSVTSVDLGGLSESRFLSSFLYRIKRSARASAFLFVTSPLFFKIVGPAFKPDPHHWALISEVTRRVWGKVDAFEGKYQQFLLETVSEKIITYERLVSQSFIVVRDDQDKPVTYSPLVNSYFKLSIREMKKTIQIYNTPYIDEEGDSDDLLDQTDPTHVLQELLMRPNPLDKALFQRRFDQKIKLNQLFVERFLKSLKGQDLKPCSNRKIESILKTIENTPGVINSRAPKW